MESLLLSSLVDVYFKVVSPYEFHEIFYGIDL